MTDLAALLGETIVPAIQEVTKDNSQDILRAVKNILDVREGRLGDPLDANVTFRDLVANGFAQTNAGFTPSNRGLFNPVFPITANSDGYDPTTDYTQPVTPSNLTGTAGFSAIYLSWTGAGYKNPAYTEVWRSATNVLGNAVMIGTTISNSYADAITSTSSSYYYWIRFVSEANVKGPYNSTSGTLVSTTKVGGADLNDLIITAAKLADGAVTSGKIGSNAVTSAKLADLAVEAAKLADSAVTATKIANLAVGTAAIADAAITSAQIANLAVGNAAIANLAVTNAKINDVTVDKLTTGTLTASVGISSGYIYSGVDNSKVPGDPLFGTGYFLGQTDGKQQFYVGSSSNYMWWNGSSMAVKGTIRADSGLIGGCTIASSSIYSDGYSAGSAGWRLTSGGNAFLNNAEIRGGVYGGDFTGTLWPTNSNAVGFALDQYGLKIGDWNGGSKFVWITNDGSFYAPKLSIVGGNATFSGTLSGTIVYADNIVSRAATYFTQSAFSVKNDSTTHYSSTSFYMDRAGYVAFVVNYLFAYSGSDCSWEIKLGIDDYVSGGVTTPYWYTSQSGSFYSSAGPNGGVLQTNTYLSSGWHTLYGYCYHSCGGSNYQTIQALILRSYR